MNTFSNWDEVPLFDSEQAEAAMLVLRTSAARSVSGPETHPGSGGEPVLVEEAAE